MGWLSFLRRLFGRRPESAPIDEQEAYARSYGDRSGEILRVEPVVEEPAAAESRPELAAVERPRVEEQGLVQPHESPFADLTGELLRRAFELRLDTRRKHSHH